MDYKCILNAIGSVSIPGIKVASYYLKDLAVEAVVNTTSAISKFYVHHQFCSNGLILANLGSPDKDVNLIKKYCGEGVDAIHLKDRGSVEDFQFAGPDGATNNTILQAVQAYCTPMVSTVASAVVTTVAPIVNSMVNTLVDGTQPTTGGYGNYNSTGIGEDLNFNENADGDAVLWPYIAGGAIVGGVGTLIYKKYAGKTQGVRVPEEQAEHEEMLDSMPNVETAGIGMLSSILSCCYSGNQGVRVSEVQAEQEMEAVGVVTVTD